MAAAPRGAPHTSRPVKSLRGYSRGGDLGPTLHTAGGAAGARAPPHRRRAPLYSPNLVTCVVRLPPCLVHSNMALHSCNQNSSSTAEQNTGRPASLGLAPLCRSKQPRLLLRLQPAAKALVLGRKLRDAALVLAGRARPPRPARVARGVLQCHAFTIARR